MGDISTERLLGEAMFDLGDVVLDPGQWPTVMDRICRFAGATGAFLVQASARTPDVPRTDSVEEFVNDYFHNGWHMRDVRAERGAPALLFGSSVVIDQDIFTRDEIAKEPLYNECNLKHGLAWFAGIKVSAGSALWAIAVQRSVREGPFTESEKGLLALFSRPLSEVATLSAMVGSVALKSAMSAMDGIDKPVVALGRQGRVLGMNLAVESLFDDDFHPKNGRLFAKDGDSNHRLALLANQLTRARDTEPVVASRFLIRRTSKAPLIVCTTPIHGAARAPFLGARALLIISATGLRSGVEPTLLSEVYGLTPAEARIAAFVAEGRRPEDIARQMKTSPATVKNQLKVVFHKTSVHRQAELAALLADFPRR